ncbi:HpcH/HpaI aldolase/citrate lyase family protein [Nocardia sp. NPDC059246]|uniref:HpcH/HpaI aldolase family protein n=1 Tax=unclassified Nocardia TaxID=2637762 RepID=UPI0036D0E276
MLPSALATEIVSAAGADWLCIDLQHGQIDEGEMRAMVQAAAIRGTPAVVRVPWNEPSSIMRALDAGADGVIIPMINSGTDAQAAAEATRFPPRGTRSWGPLRPAMTYPGYSPELANELAVCLVMVETVEAVANIDAILDVAEVDGVFVGPKDLAISRTGHVANAIDSPESLEMFRKIAAACRARGLVAGTICDTAEEVRLCREMGYSLIALRPDAVLLGDSMRQQLSAVRVDRPVKDVV